MEPKDDLFIKDIIEYTMDLANLGLEESEKEEFKEQLKKIISYIEKIQELDLKDTPPLSYVVEEFPTQNLREDKASIPSNKEALLKEAPQRKKDYFVVPKVI